MLLVHGKKFAASKAADHIVLNGSLLKHGDGSLPHTLMQSGMPSTPWCQMLHEPMTPIPKTGQIGSSERNGAV